MSRGRRARRTRSRAARRRKLPRPASRFDTSRLLPLLLFLVVLGVYAPSAANDFVYDDNEVIVNQKAPASFADVAGIFGERHFPNLPYYRPVTRTTLLLQKTFHGDNPAPFHLLNAAFMALAAVVVYFLLRLPVFGVSRTLALLGAALFALHPIASSCVYPTASGRETLLPSLWTLLSVYAYLRRGRGWRVLSLVAFTGALFSKEQAVVIPALFVLADLAGMTPDPPRWNIRRWIVRYLPLLPILAGYFWIRHLLFGGTEYAFGEITGPLFSLGYAFQTIFLPSVELVYEPTLAIWLSWPRLIVSCLAVAGLLVLALRLEPRRRPVLLFWSGWFLVTLAPTANIIQQEARYDERYLFLASLALIAVAAAVVSQGDRSGRAGGTVAAVGLLLVGAAGFISFHRSAYFHDNLAFSRQWLRTDPQSVNAHYNLGFGLAQQGRHQEAVEAYERALEIEPDYGFAHNNLGNALDKVGRHEEAIGHFRKALELDPAYSEAHHNLTNVLVEENRLEEALEHAREAVRLRPDFAEAQNNLGNLLTRRGDAAEGVSHYRSALELKPGYAEAHNNLANALVALGRLREAISHYSEAIRIRPDYPDARRNRELVLMELTRRGG